MLLVYLTGCSTEDNASENHALAPSDSEVTVISDKEASSESNSSSEEKKLELENDGEYIVCCLSSDSITINSTDDFKNYNVGYMDDCDSMRYAEFYLFKGTAPYNAAHDAHSGLIGGTVDLIIIDKMSYNAFSDLKIVWDFTK